MIASLRGTLEAKSLDSALVAIGGVTLRVLAPLSVLARLTVGQPVALQTYLLVREDALTLYGFMTADDRDCFEQLLQVGGVGPSIGLALLSNMPAQVLREAVVNEDVTRIALTPRVGKKLAARLVLELRPRFEKMGIAAAMAGVGTGGPTGNLRGQVMEALTNLGYPPAEAASAVRSLPDDATGSLEDLILLALRSLARE